ncbi:hypothetical protein HGG78_07955 [Vibrio aestuarianus]|uniref:hypothetical protein n=1 Tax=Vibrio aestuarianus TaxID=28171 RepID=UPI001558A34E|nr:hypothetical protein [Vibrio aestuarianus]NGZ13676.1 hypothetical protein [Vibrio aestuarianus]NKZ49824.1 hypothetical protein [Vibrio aestuarianus]
MCNSSLIRTQSSPSLPLYGTGNSAYSLAVKGVTNTGMKKLPLHRPDSAHEQKLFENKRSENLTGGKNELGRLENAISSVNSTTQAFIVSKSSDLNVIHDKSINKFVFHSIFGFGISHSDSFECYKNQKITHAALAKYLFGTAKFVTSAGMIRKGRDGCYVIDNDSGHYNPDAESLMKVQSVLESLGCSVKIKAR